MAVWRYDWLVLYQRPTRNYYYHYNHYLISTTMGTQCVLRFAGYLAMIGWYSTSNQAPPQFQPPSTLVALFSFKLALMCYCILLPSTIQHRGLLKVGLISLQTTQILCIALGPLKSWLDFTADAMRCHHQESNALCSDLTRKRRGDPEETFGLSMLFILAV